MLISNGSLSRLSEDRLADHVDINEVPLDFCRVPVSFFVSVATFVVQHNNGFAKTFVPYWHSRPPMSYPQRPAIVCNWSFEGERTLLKDALPRPLNVQVSPKRETQPPLLAAPIPPQDNVPYFNCGSAAYHSSDSMRRYHRDSHAPSPSRTFCPKMKLL
jgi:hypothetical protein